MSENNQDQIIKDCLSKNETGMSFRDIGDRYGRSRESVRSLYRRWKLKHDSDDVKNFKDTSININDDGDKLPETELFNRLKIERLKLQQEKNEIRNYLKKYTNIEKIIEECQSAINNLLTFPYSPLYNFCNNNKELVMMLSDIHEGEKCDITPINKYDSDIIRERLQKYFSKVKHIAQDHKTNKINVCLLGDLITNFNIFRSQIFKTDEDIISQIIQVSETLSQLMYELGKQFNLDIYYVTGNHGVVSRDLGVTVNFEKLVVEFIKARLKDNKNIKFYNSQDINGSWSIAKIFNYNYLLMHGDQLGEKNAPYRIKEILHNVGYNICEVLVGHNHHSHEDEIFSNGFGILSNGSIIGGNEYSFNKLMISTKPSQTCFVVEEGEGRTATYRVKLS